MLVHGEEKGIVVSFCELYLIVLNILHQNSQVGGIRVVETHVKEDTHVIGGGRRGGLRLEAILYPFLQVALVSISKWIGVYESLEGFSAATVSSYDRRGGGEGERAELSQQNTVPL